MEKTDKPSGRYQELDALRGVASIMIVLFHLTMEREESQWGFKYGTTGVDLFFIISGFVIFMSLNKVNSSKEFIINRISRLYPTYWACVTFTFFIVILLCISSHEPIPFKQYAANMTMFQYYLTIANLDGQYWTMIVEMLFYIFILFLFSFRLLKYIIPIALTAALLIVAASLLLPVPMVKMMFKLVPFLEFEPMFFVGILFYKIFTEEDKKKQNYFILIISLVCQVLLYKYAGRSELFISQEEYAIMLSSYFVIFVLFINGKLKVLIN